MSHILDDVTEAIGKTPLVRIRRLIRGGAAVLAHPHTVAAGAAEYAAALEAFAALGGAGVECYYPDYPPDLQGHLAAVTRRLGMAPTGGSDYHGEHRPGIALGTGRGDLRVPDEVVAELGRRRKG